MTRKTYSKTTATRRDAYQEVTDRITAALEAGTVPWRKPWAGVPGQARIERPRNAVTGKAYRGINVFLLGMGHSYSDPRWLTFKQAQAKGGSVRRGQHGTQIVFWRIVTKDTVDEATGETVRSGYPMLRIYTVFNVEQCDGLTLETRPQPYRTFTDWPELVQPPAPRASVIAEAEAIVAAYTSREAAPSLAYDGGDRAFYVPARDEIHLPARDSFESIDAMYATTFHEMAHSTGHASRLDRFSKSPGPSHFGSENYSQEELTAELGSAFLCDAAGVDASQLGQSAAYIASWLSVLRGDKKFVIVAAARAQKAADLILGPDESEPGEEEQAA